MKKIITKLTAVLFTVLAVFSMTNTVSAQKITGQITVNNAVAGETYNAYKVFDLTYKASGSAVTQVSYTVDSDWEAFFLGDGSKYIKDYDVPYCLKSDGSVDTTATTKATCTATSGNTWKHLNPITFNGKTRYIYITEANVAEFSKDALAYTVSNNLVASPDASVVATSTTATITGLNYGYYLVYNGLTEDNGYSTIVSLTSTTPDAETNRKATNPTIDKNIIKVVEADGSVAYNNATGKKSSDVQVGDTVTYKITGKVLDTTGYGRFDYTVTDSMTKGLTLNEDVKVTVGGTEVTNTTVANTITYSGNTFTVYLNLKNYTKDAEIVITYSAVVNEDAVNRINENSVVLEYASNPAKLAEHFTTTPVKNYVYTTELSVFKYENDLDVSTNSAVASEAALGLKSIAVEGAQFVLKATNGDHAGEYYYYDSTTKAVKWISEANKGSDYENVTVAETDENGYINFIGLLPGSYELIEIEAPNGYNLMQFPVVFEIERTNDKATDASSNVSFDLSVAEADTWNVTSSPAVTKTASVILVDGDAEATNTELAINTANYAGTLLPSTGGIGTTIFVIVGSLLILGAFIVLYTDKKADEE